MMIFSFVRKNRFCFQTAVVAAFLISLFCITSYAETYNFTLRTSINNNYETATLTACDLSGNTKWVYYGGSYPAAELSHFNLLVNDGCVYLVENGIISSLDFFTGEKLWTNPDFKGSPAADAYTFSSSGKLYISGYYGPDLYVIDKDGNTIARVDSLYPGEYWISNIWFYSGDNMRIIYDSSSHLYTFNVLDYFGRTDGLRK